MQIYEFGASAQRTSNLAHDIQKIQQSTQWIEHYSRNSDQFTVLWKKSKKKAKKYEIYVVILEIKEITK